MDVKKLFKQTCVFERHSLKLDTHDDNLSNIDWHKLAETLSSSEPTVRSISAKFQIKLAQRGLEGLTEDEKAQYNASHPDMKPVDEQGKAEINEKIKQMLSNPENTPQANYEREMAKVVQEWVAQHSTFTEVELDGAVEQWTTTHPDPSRKPMTNDMMADMMNELLDPEEHEFKKQDKEIQQFMDKEQADKAAQQRSIQGKTPFSVQDAAAIINSELNEIKTYVQQVLKRKLIGDQKLMFIFYPNGNVGTVGQDIPMVNAIRRGFATPLQLASRSFCVMHKKYFTGEIKYEMSL